MRLIDVDELKKRATKVMFRDAPECGEFDAVAVDDVNCMQTIDPKPCGLRRTGKTRTITMVILSSSVVLPARTGSFWKMVRQKKTITSIARTVAKGW